MKGKIRRELRRYQYSLGAGYGNITVAYTDATHWTYTSGSSGIVIHWSVVWRPFGENDATQSHELTNQYHKRNDKDISPHRKPSPSE